MADFKVGDKVCFYTSRYAHITDTRRIVGIVSQISDGDLIMECERYGFMRVHPKQCRILIKKPKFKIGDTVYGNGHVYGNLPYEYLSYKGTIVEIDINKSDCTKIKTDHGILLFLKTSTLKKLESKVDSESEKPFDPAKPVMTRDGRKARIICTDISEVICDKPIIALITLDNGEEKISYYLSNGCIINSQQQCLDLINIPEPKPIDLHAGGVYELRNKEIVNIVKINSFGLFESHNLICSNENVKPLIYYHNKDGSHWPQDKGKNKKFDILEKLGDIRDLSHEIKSYFENKK